MGFSKHLYFYLFISFLFLGITSVNLFSDGMFMDGLLYATIARNMAEGFGSFWQPHFSYGLFDEFYEHPPLALGLQSLAFRLFGDSIYVERFYSLFAFILIGYLIVLIWNELTGEKKYGWIPLLFFITIRDISWAAANNMLENTMSIFVCLSVFFYLKSNKKNSLQWLFFSGTSLSLALLTKGFFCLYIWSLPFFMWLFLRKKTFLNMMFDSLVLVTITILPVFLLFLFNIDAQNNMINYFNKQILGSFQKSPIVDSRFIILVKFIENIIVSVLIMALILFAGLKKNISQSISSERLKTSLMFIAIVLSGIIPIMISMKQRGFYILSVYPFYAIAISYYFQPYIKRFIAQISFNSKIFYLFKIFTVVIISISITLSLLQINRTGRDHTLINDSKKIIDVVGKYAVVDVCKNMRSNWSLHGYLARYGHVSLDRSKKNSKDYYITSDNCHDDFLFGNYMPVPIKSSFYKLYKVNETKNE